MPDQRYNPKNPLLPSLPLPFSGFDPGFVFA
jgi:hypothetical protein